MKPHCDRFLRYRLRPDGWGSEPVQCHATVGVSTWVDTAGVTRHACGKHRAALERRYPEGAWTVGELMEGFGK